MLNFFVTTLQKAETYFKKIQTCILIVFCVSFSVYTKDNMDTKNTFTPNRKFEILLLQNQFHQFFQRKLPNQINFIPFAQYSFDIFSFQNNFCQN